jgi:hypothetical protein
MTLEQDIQAAKDAIAKTKAAEAKAAKDKEAAAKKEAAGRAKAEATARTAAQRKKDEALLNSMIATRKKLIQYIADPDTSARDKAAAEVNLKGRNGSPSLDASIAKLSKSLNIAVEGGKIIKRPMSVPSAAVYNSSTKGWTRGNENWDASGKRVGEDTATAATPPKEPGAGFVTTGGKLLKDGATFSGTYQGKIYKNGVATGNAPQTSNQTGGQTSTQTTGQTGGQTGKEVPSGFNVGTFRAADEASMGAPRPAGTQVTPTLTGFDKILAKAKTTYGEVDEIFASDAQLRKLLTDAIGKVEDVNDDMTGDEFLRRLKNTDWWGSQAGTVRQRQFEKRQYERLKAKLGDPKSAGYQEKLAKLNQEDEYGRGLQDTIDAIKLAADQSGASMSDDDILTAATDLYGLAFENNESRISKKINTFISSKGVLKGATGTAIQQLRQAATANGFDLETKYAGQIDGWLQQIAAGKSINDFKNIIRDDAGKAQPKYVQDLLRSGYDLDGVYGNYINLMAQTLNIDPNTIKLNDPILMGIFTDKGGMTFNDFTAKLRSDKRFAGTIAEGGTKDLRQSIADRALALGVPLAEADVDDITNNALSMGIGASSSLVDKLIRAKFTYSPGKVIGGAAGGALGQLKATAAANGFDFDKQFGTQAQTWLGKILQGESPDTFKNIIRQTAKLGLPEKVGALLDLGVDLDAIYSPYKNVMASVLEINPQTIGLDDKTLRSAIGPDKEMTIYDWERSLRKDPRWQYTNNARQEVSSIGLNVLQQLGFQG